MKALAHLCGWSILICLLVLGHGWRIAPDADALVDLIVTATFVAGAWFVAACFVNVISSAAKKPNGAKP